MIRGVRYILLTGMVGAAAGCQWLPIAAILTGPPSSPDSQAPPTTPGTILDAVLFKAPAPGEPVVDLPPADARRFAGYRKLVDATHGQNRLLVYSYGQPARLLDQHRLAISGYVAVVVNRRAGRIVHEEGVAESDAPTIIDYRQAGVGVYEFTACTTDPREPRKDVPLWVSTVTVLPDGRCREKRELALAAPAAADPKDVVRWRDGALAALASNEPDRAQFAEEAMGHLRNLAVSYPEETLAAMDALRLRIDGTLLPVWERRVEEIRAIRTLRGRPPVAPALPAVAPPRLAWPRVEGPSVSPPRVTPPRVELAPTPTPDAPPAPPDGRGGV